jgi:hypothetical protein
MPPFLQREVDEVNTYIASFASRSYKKYSLHIIKFSTSLLQ